MFNSSFAQIGTSKTTSYSDTTVSPGITYLHHLRAVNGAAVESEDSALDYATTILFTNDTLPALTPIITTYTQELRNAAAALGASAGMTAPSFTDGTLTGVPVRAVHVQQVRDYVRTAVGMLTGHSPTFTNDPLQPGTLISAGDIQDLRTALK